MSAAPIDVTVLVPVYNSAASIELVVTRTTEVLRGADISFEFVLVDDGSSDRSWEVIDRLSRELPHVRSIHLLRNYGQHNALLAGIREAKGAWTVTMDDDLQHPPAEILRLLGCASEGNLDVVYGTPHAGAHSAFRNLTSWLTKVALRATMRSEIARHVSAFRLFRTHLRDAFANYDSPWVSIDVLLTWGTTRMGWVSVRHDAREIGRSNYTVWKLLSHALSMLTGFSTLPLRIASLVGLGFTIAGVGVLAYVLYVYVAYGRAVPGFAFLAAIITIFAGAQLFALGVIGEYLARVHLRSMGKPPYAIDRRESDPLKERALRS